MSRAAVVALFVVASLILIVGMFIYWVIPSVNISSTGTITTGSQAGLILIFAGIVLIFLSIFLVPVRT